MIERQKMIDQRNKTNEKVYKKKPDRNKNTKNNIKVVETFEEMMELIKKNPKENKKSFIQYLNSEADKINKHNL